ncbi:MAG: TIGR04086 family membrane protein [Lachnospiraceae bacterium]|nr:TIGR04086 family membrane protein [Lachnospiraceae bacterium]
MGTDMETGIGQVRKSGKGIGRLAAALVVSYLITVLALFGIVFVMLKLQPDTGTTELLILAVYVLSCFAGGWYAGRRAGRRKFLQGLLVGLLYFALLFLISGMGEREIQSDLAAGALACLLCAAGGMLGGMLA